MTGREGDLSDAAEGNDLPPVQERHDVVLRQVEGPNPPDLLEQIIKEVKRDLAELVPIAGKAVGKYVGAKGEEAVARVQEIRSRIYQNIGQLELERQRLIQRRDESMNIHSEKMKELEIQRLREKTQGLKEVVDCIVRLKALGITINLKVVRRAERGMTDLLEME